MLPHIRCLAAAALLTALAGAALPVTSARAQEPSTLPSQDLKVWTKRFPVPDAGPQEVAVARLFQVRQEVRPFTGQTIVGLGVSGIVQFTSDRGLVRVVMVDDLNREFLVYETYATLARGNLLRIRDACRETCLLGPVVPAALKVELVDASLELQTMALNQLRVPGRGRGAPPARHVQEVRKAQQSDIVRELNRRLKARGKKWTAGDTAISRLSYAEKKALMACAAADPDALANLQGAEYYTGGILEVRGGQETPGPRTAAAGLVDAFDWRSRHGANRPGSPYYDGDATGSGWLTSVKSQRCADCWAHSALGATEALANLYFNQHLDLDLSEQELVSCSGAGSCQYGGNTGSALYYVQNSGILNEACFPESGLDEACNVCPAPQDRIQITGFDYVNPWDGEDSIKRKLIASGPLPFGIASWWHAIVLAGFERESGTGDTVWIIKNSWGPGWGEQGYGRVKVPLSDIYLTYNLYSRVVSQIRPYEIACNDADGDGYFNWGISSDTPASCGDVPAEKDCDDSDPTLALMTEEGECTAAPPRDTAPPIVTTAADPVTIWSPTGKAVPVVIAGTISDEESGVDANTAAYAVVDEYGSDQPYGPISLGADGSYTVTLLLPASRLGGDRDGRHYTITVTAQDHAGNTGSAAVVVLVPHDMRPSATD